MKLTMNSSTPILCNYGESLLALHSVTAHAHLVKSFWGGYEGEFRIFTMDWYINKVRSFDSRSLVDSIKVHKGETVQEDMPRSFPYYKKYTVQDGPPTEITTVIRAFSDPNNVSAPQLNTRKPGNSNVSDALN